MGRSRNHLGFDLGKRLRQLRTARGLSPEDLAKQTGFYAFHITEVETGTAVPSLPSLEKWARALGVELWQVLTGRQAAVLDIRDSRAAAFHPTERTLVVGGAATVHVVDVDRGEIARTLANAHGGDGVYGVAFSSAGQVLATVSDQGSLKLWSWPALSLRASVSMSKSLEPMAPVSLALGRQGTRAAANGILGTVHIVDVAKEREERTFANTPEAPGHGMHAEMRRSLAFTQDGAWLFAPDLHDRGLRILHVASGKAYPVFRGDGPFYKAMSIAVPASMVALLRPGDDQGRGPYGLEVWRLTYRAP